MNNSPKHLALLDQLRGVAILLVLFAHTFGIAFSRFDILPWDGWFRSFPHAESFLFFLPNFIAPAGVPIFFVVSGFCIHLSFQQQGRKWGSFFIRRVFRIYPAYLAALILSVALSMQHYQIGLGGEGIWNQLWTHLLLVHNFSPGTISQFNPPFWSLAVEAQLYLLYPLLLILTSRFGWWRIMGILCMIEIVIQGMAANTTSNLPWVLGHSPFGFWFSWALGALIADAYLNKKSLPFLKGHPLPWLALALVCTLVKPLFAFNFTVFAVLAAVIIIRLLRSEPKTSFVPIQKIGLWSYSLYLLHLPLLYIFYYALMQIFPYQMGSHVIAFFLLALACVAIIAFSILSYRLIELPGIAAGKWVIRKLERTTIQLPQYNLMKSVVWVGVIVAACIACYMANAKFIPVDPSVNNNLAWSLATDMNPAKRNGVKAIELAEDACRRADHLETIMVGTLAAAYAEAGRFDDAIETAKRACLLAEQNGQTNLLQKNQRFLSLYLDHKPYHEQ